MTICSGVGTDLCSGNLCSPLLSSLGMYAKLGWEDVDSFVIYTSWITYLERRWSMCAEPVVNPHTGETFPVKRWDGLNPDIPLDDLVEEMDKEGYEYLDRSYRDVPTPPWTRREEAKFQGRLVTGSIPPGSNLRVYLS